MNLKPTFHCHSVWGFEPGDVGEPAGELGSVMVDRKVEGLGVCPKAEETFGEPTPRHSERHPPQ